MNDMLKKLPKRLKQSLARLSLPVVRACLRYTPLRPVRRAFWSHVVLPRYWWRRFDFVASTRFGAKVIGNTGEVIQKYICYFGIWEPNLTAWIKERLKPGDVFIDVGANIGYFSLLASRLVGKEGHVVAIEASPPVFELLRRNLHRNRAQNVRAVNVAVSDREGEVQLYAGPDNDCGRTTAAQTLADQYNLRPSAKVQALPLVAILHDEEIRRARLIKIDVEGYEWHVLSGMEAMLESCRPDIEIMVELSPPALESEGRTTRDFFGILNSLGFHAYTITNDYAAESHFLSEDMARPVKLRETALSAQVDLIFSRLDAASI